MCANPAKAFQANTASLDSRNKCFAEFLTSCAITARLDAKMVY